MPRLLAALLLAAALVPPLLAPPASAADAAEPSYVLAAPSSARAGNVVPASLTALDGDGVPLAGLAVRFVRTGPGAETAASCSVEQLAGCAVTGADGTARYDFSAGPLTGLVQLRAEVYGVEGELVAEAGPHAVQVVPAVVCRAARTSCIRVLLSGRSKAPGRDVLSVVGPMVLRGGHVLLQAKVHDAWRPIGRVRSMNRDGDATFSVPDRNGSRVTKYRAIVLPGAWSLGDVSPVLRLP